MTSGSALDNVFARRLLKTGLLAPDEIAVYRRQMAAFREKFGREMGPDDPFFFDPDADTPRFRSPNDADHALGVIAELMSEAGIEPALIYAFKRTRGLFPNGPSPLTPEEMSEWEAAVEEYHRSLTGTDEQ